MAPLRRIAAGAMPAATASRPARSSSPRRSNRGSWTRVVRPVYERAITAAAPCLDARPSSRSSSRRAGRARRRRARGARASCPRASCARGRAGSGRRASPSGRPRARPPPRRGAAPRGGGATFRRPRGSPRRRTRSASRRRGSARSTRSAPTRRRCSPPWRTPRDSSCARESIAASFPASRWRWSSSCSAVSTTEVTIPGRQTTPPEVHTAPSPVSRATSRIARASFAAPASASRRLSIGVEPACAAWPVQRDPVALDAEGAEHDAERQVERLEHGALLDVELEVGGRARELRVGVERPVEVDPVRADRVGQRDAVAVGRACAARPGRPSSRRRPTSRRASGRSARPPRRPSRRAGR